MRMIAPSLLLLLSGCVSLTSSRDETKAWDEVESAVKNGTDPKLRLGMRIDDAMTHLEKNGFKRDSDLWYNYTDAKETDERPSFHYRKVIPATFLVADNIEFWLYYDAGKLIDIRERQYRYRFGP